MQNHFAMVRTLYLLNKLDIQLSRNEICAKPIINEEILAGANRFSICRNPKVRRNVFSRGNFDSSVESDFIDYLLVNNLNEQFEDFINPELSQIDNDIRNIIEGLAKNEEEERTTRDEGQDLPKRDRNEELNDGAEWKMQSRKQRHPRKVQKQRFQDGSQSLHQKRKEENRFRSGRKKEKDPREAKVDHHGKVEKTGRRRKKEKARQGDKGRQIRKYEENSGNQ